MPGIEYTKSLVKAAFAGIMDKGGAPYDAHLYRVADRLVDGTEDEKIAALLHDIVEDTDYTLSRLIALGYSNTVVEMVDILTRRDEETYSEYIERIANSGNESAIRVKIADLNDNMSPARLSVLPKHEQKIVKRYQKSLEKFRTLMNPEVYASIREGNI